MAKSILNTPTKRRNLKPRSWPYWETISKGRSIGFYRSEDGGNWHARIRQPDGSYDAKPLHGSIDSNHSEMLEKAQEWINRAAGIQDTRYTIQSCVDDYIAHLRVEKSDSPANYAHGKLRKHLLPKLGKVVLADMTTAQLKRWRDSLVKKSNDPETVRKSKDTANRVLSQTKAAFNLAYRNGVVSSDKAWKRVKAFENVGQNRTLFLTDNHVTDLLAATVGNFHKLVKTAVLTGARYGELTTAKVEDLDIFNGCLRVTGKTGTRSVYLSSSTLAYLKSLTRDRLPGAYLLDRDDGEPWGTGHQHRRLIEAVQAAKLPAETVFYSLRHYHISKALLSGMQIQVIAENCGTSVRMIEKHYGKFLATDRRKMMDQVELGVV